MFKRRKFLILIFFLNFIFNSSLFGNDLINQKIENFILNNPEIILKSLENYQKKIENSIRNEEKEFIKNYEFLIGNDPIAYYEGNQNSAIVFVNFIDYKCIYCKKASKDILEILNENKNVKYVIKELPILGNQSLIASKMALSVLIEDGPEIYKKLHLELLETNDKLTKKKVINILKKIGSNFDEKKAIINNEKIEEHLKNNFFIAKNLNISGTPSYIIGNTIIRGYVEKSVLIDAIKNVKNKIN